MCRKKSNPITGTKFDNILHVITYRFHTVYRSRSWPYLGIVSKVTGFLSYKIIVKHMLFLVLSEMLQRNVCP
jgi:hypothetical protein